MKTLIVIDMQKDFIDGALGTKEAVEIVPRVKQKIAEYVSRGDEIIFTRDTHFENYLNTHEGENLPVPHCIKGTKGWEIPSDIDIPECEHIDKIAFGYTAWDFAPADSKRITRDFDEIEIIGLCTDICVVSNALILRALYPENKITVDASCCAGTTPEMHEKALDVMKSCQINIVDGHSFEVREIYDDGNIEYSHFNDLDETLQYFTKLVRLYRTANNEGIDVVYVQDIDAGETVVRYAPYE